MAFEINGETWQPQSATEHAEKIVQRVNELLQENNILDSEGNIAALKQNFANALYLLALGDGQRFADNDAKLERAINSFNVSLCDDQQIENLLPIAAITRNPGSYSTLRLAVTASESGTCTIPAGTKAPYGDVNFVVDNEAVITAGSTQIINTTCDTIGPVAVLSGEVTSFDTDIPNLESVTNAESSVPGVAKETTTQLRRRLIAGDTIKYSLDGCKNALEELTGVATARVYFNYNTGVELELPGGVELSPRTAYIVVNGDSSRIGEVYSEYMSAPTQNSQIAGPTASTVKMSVLAGSSNAELPAETTVTYNGFTFEIDAPTTVPAGTTVEVPFTCTVTGPVTVPANGITELDQEIANVENAINLVAAIPGMDDPRHEQTWVTSSGQAIPIKYDYATEQKVFVRVWLEEDADFGTQVDNQIKRDLIIASSAWKIGESVTQLSTSAPFIDCSYTKVAYTEVSTDGETWEQYLTIGCNVIPRISDATIEIEQIGD